MLEVLEDLRDWWATGRPAGLATVVATSGSAPRQAGSAMLVLDEGAVLGCVSGGCVEGAVYESTLAALRTGEPSLARYGVSDEDAFAVGLTCGGTLEVFSQRVDAASHPGLGALADDVRSGRPIAVATLIEHTDPSLVGRHLLIRPAADGAPDDLGGLGSARLDAAVRDDAEGLLATGADGMLRYGPDGECEGNGARVFVASFAPRPRMVLLGAVDLAGPLSRIGAFLGYHVTVCDARAVFATRRRFPHADEVVVDWPHRYLASEDSAGRLDQRTVVVVLTHDTKFDVPALATALRLPVAYVGAMGSRRTHRERLDRLRSAGVGETDLARLASPVGLDLGARTPEETAVSVAAEIVSRRRGGTGRPLSAVDGPIHRPVPEVHGDVSATRDLQKLDF